MNASPGKLETALFAVGLAMSGLVLLALVWSGTAAYEDMARSNGVTGGTFVSDPDGARGTVAVDLPRMVEWHRMWSAYVTGGSEAFGSGPGAEEWFTNEERSHMADVRRVFDGAKILIPAGFFVMAIRLQRARAHGVEAMLQLARDGAVAAGVAVTTLGIIAALAFDQAFLLFHEVFFPQGNFLFDPATSNLLRLYPDWYWQGITIRIGLSFIALAAAVVVAASIGLRRARSTRLASE
jgi:integral membrane protein (TIGR01906 family)